MVPFQGTIVWSPSEGYEILALYTREWPAASETAGSALRDRCPDAICAESTNGEP